MSALKILIIEDDLLLAEEIQEQLLEFGYTITDNVSNSKDAVTAFRRRLPDMVLCDIHLEGSELDGIQLAGIFNSIERVPLIFLTAFGDAATVERAKAVNPAYYLIKPCNQTQLQIALDFAISNYTQQREAEVQHSLHYQKTPSCALYSTKDFFFVKDGYKYVRIEANDILWVEALGSNVKIVTETSLTVLSANLSSFIQQVQHPILVRVHRSFILNIHKIIAFDSGRAFVAYQGGQKEIPISKSYREDIQGHLPKLSAD